MDRLGIYYKKGTCCSVLEVALSWRTKKLTRTERDKVVKAIRKKYVNFIGEAKPHKTLKRMECILNHSFVSFDSSQFMDLTFCNKDYEDEEYWKDRVLVAKEEDKDVIERPLAIYDKSITYAEKRNKQNSLIEFRVEGYDYWFLKLKQADLKYYGERDDTLSYNKKTGKLTFSRDAKFKILNKMKQVVIKKNNINKDLALKILDKEMELIGINKKQTKLIGG